jgi:DeoR/GlpR family transcriptional regulator of sugar metabolism
MNQLVVERADHAYVLVDSSKFGRSSFVQYAGFGEVETVFTDAGLAEETRAAFTAAGARIQTVGE